MKSRIYQQAKYDALKNKDYETLFRFSSFRMEDFDDFPKFFKEVPDDHLRYIIRNFHGVHHVSLGGTEWDLFFHLCEHRSFSIIQYYIVQNAEFDEMLYNAFDIEILCELLERNPKISFVQRKTLIEVLNF